MNIKSAAEQLIEEAEKRAIVGGRSISLQTALWAIVVASEGGLDRYRGIGPHAWHDCPTCGLYHRKDPRDG